MSVSSLLGAQGVANVIGSAKRTLGWGRLTIGLGIGSESLRAVGMAGGCVRWAIELQRENGDSLSASVATLLSRRPFQKSGGAFLMRPQVVVAIGPSLVQVKRLSGLPLLQDPAALSSVVREGAGRFFLKNGVPLLTTEVSLIEPGTGWAAAFDAPAVEESRRTCLDAGFIVRDIVPAAIALGQAAGNGELSWTDGSVQAQLAYRDRDLVAIRQLRVAHEKAPACGEEPPYSRVPLELLRECPMQYADAYGAALLCRGARPMLSIGERYGAGSGRRVRLLIAATVLCISVTAALLTPPLLAKRSATRARSRIAMISPQVRQVRDAERELDQISKTLARVTDIEAERQSFTLLLARITAALPAQTAIVAFETDSSKGTIVALAPRSSQVTEALETVSGVASPHVVGPITSTTTRQGQMERVIVQFWLLPPYRRGDSTLNAGAANRQSGAMLPQSRSGKAHGSGDPL